MKSSLYLLFLYSYLLRFLCCLLSPLQAHQSPCPSRIPRTFSTQSLSKQSAFSGISQMEAFSLPFRIYSISTFLEKHAISVIRKPEEHPSLPSPKHSLNSFNFLVITTILFTMFTCLCGFVPPVELKLCEGKDFWLPLYPQCL